MLLKCRHSGLILGGLRNIWHGTFRNYSHFNSEYFQETIDGHAVSWQVWPVQSLLQDKLKWLSKVAPWVRLLMKSKETWKTKTGKWITWSFCGKEKPLHYIDTSQEYSEGGRCRERPFCMEIRRVSNKAWHQILQMDETKIRKNVKNV